MTFEPRSYGYQAVTFCDFGDKTRREKIARHLSVGAAARRFKSIALCYSHLNGTPDKQTWRCWQEDREGFVINDTNNMQSN